MPRYDTVVDSKVKELAIRIGEAMSDDGKEYNPAMANMAMWLAIVTNYELGKPKGNFPDFIAEACRAWMAFSEKGEMANIVIAAEGGVVKPKAQA